MNKTKKKIKKSRTITSIKKGRKSRKSRKSIMQSTRKGGNPLKRKSSHPNTSQSRRFSVRQYIREGKIQEIHIPTATLGVGDPTRTTYGRQQLTMDVIETFVHEKIKPGYNIVCLPTPPDDSHTIVVHITDDNRIMIVNWDGEIDRTTINKTKANKMKWKNYFMLIDCLTRVYGDITYYEVDESVYALALQRHERNNGQGGCSEYVEQWLKKHVGYFLYKEIKKDV